MDIKELVGKAQQGDREAFDHLVREHLDRLYSFVFGMARNHEDTDDILQTTWLKAHRAIGKFRNDSSFSTWIHAIALNTTRTFIKKRDRQSTTSLEVLALPDQPDTIDTVQEVKNNEIKKRLNEAMNQLSEKHRTVVFMFDIQGLSHAEISEVLGVREGTVRSRLHYAHQELQNYLSDLVR